MDTGSWLKGYVTVQVTGVELEVFVNRATAKQIKLWNIKRSGKERLEANVSVRHFFRLKPILKSTGCRMHILKRSGFPFLLDKLTQRKVFLAGLAGFLVGLYLLTSLVWQVQVQGNDKISQRKVLQAARDAGLYTMQWKFRLKDPDMLSKELMKSLPGTSWIGVEINGTKVTIKVVESSSPKKKPLQNPRDLVASKNALVTEIQTVKGRPMVTPNTVVQKGDVLISGKIGDEENHKVVVAEGTVKGIVWYIANVDVPYVQKHRTFTGSSTNRSYLVIGNRALQLTGYGKIPYKQYEIISNRSSLHWQNRQLPVGWLHEKIMQVKVNSHRLDLKQARNTGMKQAKMEILSLAGKGSRMITQKILQEQQQKDKMKLKIYFEVEENIAKEQPIIEQSVNLQKRQ